MRGRIEFQNEQLADLVIVRSDGRPTYNFASPVEDMLDGITHVIRGNDHVSNTPTQINILRALGADLPVYAHVPDVNGDDGKKLSKRHGAVAIDDFRADGYLPAALLNFLALLGWSYDDKTTIMSRHELIERFSLERVGPSPATFDYQKLDWMNGVYLRDAAARGVRARPAPLAARAGHRLARGARARDGAARAGEDREVLAVPRLRALPLRGRRAAGGADPASAARRARAARDASSRGRRRGSRRRCARSPTSSGRSRVRRSRRSGLRSPARRSRPGLFESLELLGRDESLKRLSRPAQCRGAAGGLSGFGGASGSSARWNVAPGFEAELEGRARQRRIVRASSL